MIEGFIDPGPHTRFYSYEYKDNKVIVRLYDTNKKLTKQFEMSLVKFNNVNDRNLDMDWLWEVDKNGNVPDKWVKKPLIVHRNSDKVDSTPKVLVFKPTAPIGCKMKKQPVQAVKKASPRFVQDTFAF